MQIFMQGPPIYLSLKTFTQEKMEDWSYFLSMPNEYNDCKRSYLLDARWKEKARKAKGEGEEQWQER